MKRALVALSLLYLTACSGPSKKSTMPDDDSAAMTFHAQLKAKAVEVEAQAKAKAIEIEAQKKAKDTEARAQAAIAAKEAEAKRIAAAVEAARREGELAAQQQRIQNEQPPITSPKIQPKARVIPPPVYPPSPTPSPNARFNAEAISAHQRVVAGIRAKYIADVNGVRMAAGTDARRRMIKDGVPPELRDYMAAICTGKPPRSLTDQAKFILPRFEGWEEWDEVVIWVDAEKNFRMVLGN